MEGREIILQVKQGNKEVFSYIIEEYSNYLATVINNVYRLNTQDTEDIIAETLLSLWKSSKRLKEGLNFKSYIATIARNKTIDFVRKKRAELVELDISMSDDFCLEDDVLRKEAISLIRIKIDQIKEPDRSILLLKYDCGLRSKEIAERLCLSQNVVDIKLSRQRSRLKKMLYGMEV